MDPSPQPPTDPARGPRETRRAPTEFDWHIYADATFAGLSLLLPIPIVDAVVEQIFRRRMPRTIANWRGRALPMGAIHAVNRSRDRFWSGCLMWPVQFLIYLIRNIWRTLIYVFTIVDASEKLSYYWHRAFLIDYALGQGYLDTTERAEIAAQAMHRVLATTQTSPLLNLAREIVEQAQARLGALVRAVFRAIRRQPQSEGVLRTRMSIADQWTEFRDYLIELAGRYDATLTELERQRAATAATPAGRR